MSEYLIGSGHFAVAFIAGAVIMFAVQKVKARSLRAQLYMPFVPFILGLLASLPYAYYVVVGQKELCAVPDVFNLFFFYPLLHCNTLVISVFGNLNVVTLLCGGIYGVIILRYIHLVKHCRRTGWN